MARWYEVGREHLEGSVAQKPPPPPHFTNKSFSGVTTQGIMQMPWGKVQLHGHTLEGIIFELEAWCSDLCTDGVLRPDLQGLG